MGYEQEVRIVRSATALFRGWRRKPRDGDQLCRIRRRMPGRRHRSRSGPQGCHFRRPLRCRNDFAAFQSTGSGATAGPSPVGRTATSNRAARERRSPLTGWPLIALPLSQRRSIVACVIEIGALFRRGAEPSIGMVERLSPITQISH
jgi:hypothetical protein